MNEHRQRKCCFKFSVPAFVISEYIKYISTLICVSSRLYHHHPLTSQPQLLQEQTYIFLLTSGFRVSIIVQCESLLYPCCNHRYYAEMFLFSPIPVSSSASKLPAENKAWALLIGLVSFNWTSITDNTLRDCDNDTAVWMTYFRDLLID